MKRNEVTSDWSLDTALWETSKPERFTGNVSNIDTILPLLSYNPEIELNTQNEDIAKVREEVKELRDQIRMQQPEERVILIREIPYNDAKKEIENFIKENKTTDLEGIQNSLKLDLELIVKIVKELEQEKKISFGN